MNKRAIIKISVMSSLIATLLIALLLISTSSAITKDQYSLGEKVKFDLRDYSNYKLKVITPETSIIKSGNNDIFIFSPETTGIYKVEIKSETGSESFDFEIIGNQDKSSEDDKVSQPSLKEQNEPEEEFQIVVGEPVKQTEKLNIQGKEIKYKIPKKSKNITVSEDGEEIDYEIKDGFPIIGIFSKTKELVIRNANGEIEIEYYTKGPEKEEKIISDNKKEIIVDSDFHYENVLTYTSINESLKLTQKDLIKVYWKEENKYLNFTTIDQNNNSLIDQIRWVIPHLSTQTFEIITITKAERLNEKREFIEDVYKDVKERDDIWQEILDGEYIRIVFEKLLDKTKDITIYARSNDNAKVEVYEKDGTEKIADFGEITINGKYQILLNNLENSQDTFDLLVKGGSVEFDYIIDPVIETFLTINLTDSTNNTAYYKQTQTDITADPSWSDCWDGSEVASGGYTNLDDNDNNGFSAIASGGNGREPFTRFNFTINVNQSDINWLQISMKQRESGNPTASSEHCYYYVANFIGNDWEAFGSYVDGSTYVTRSSNISTISNYIDGDQLVILSLGTSMDASGSEGCQIDYVEVKISYNVTTNDAPTNPTPSINSTDGTNLTNQDLNCFDTLSDLNGDDMNVSVRWYKNDALELNIDYNNSYSDGYDFNAILDSENTTSGDSWICSMRLYDGANYSNWANSSALDIVSTNAPIISSISPANNSNATNPVTLSATTNKDADCEWSTTETFNYGTGVPFSVGQDSTSHSTSLGTLSKGTYTYYIKCEDEYGNNNTDSDQGETTFYVIGAAPTQSTPKLNSTFATNYTSENLTCYNQSTLDTDDDFVKNIFNWKLNGSSFENLIMPFEGGSTSSSTKDYSNYTNDGTVSGATYSSSSGYDGLGAYTFNSSSASDYISVPTDQALNFSDSCEFTEMAWINPNHPDAGYHGFLGHSGAGNSTRMPSMWIYNNTEIHAGFGNGTLWQSFTTTTDPITENTWNHVTATFDGDYYTIYVNGNIEYNNTGSWTGNCPNPSYAQLDIGRIDNYFNGTIDEVRVYNTILSTQQINAIYSNKTNTIISQETTEGETWSCEITPNDGYGDGETKSSNNLTIREQANLSISIIYPQNTTYTSNVTSLNYTYYDDWQMIIDSCWYNLNGAANVTTNCSENITSITSTEGINIWQIYYNDTIGRKASDTITFSVDTTSPNITFINQTDEDNLIVNATHPLEDGQSLTLNVNITDDNTDSVWVTVWENAKDGTKKLTTFFTSIGESIWQAVFSTDHAWRDDFNYTIYTNDSGNLTDEYNNNFSMLNMDISINLTPSISDASNNVTLSGHLNLTNNTDIINHPINIWLDGTILLLSQVVPIGTYDFYQNFTDTSSTQFDSGVYSNMTSNSENLTLSTGSTIGNYTKILDAGARVEWDKTIFNVEYPACSVQTLTFQEGDSSGYSNTQDSYIDAGNPTVNYGGEADLILDLAPDTFRTLIRFDNIIGSGSNQITSNSTIVEANITLEVSDPGSDAGVYEILENWTESQVTYDNRLTGTTWSSSGCAASPSRSTTLEDTFSTTATGPYDLNITNTVQNWVSGATENYGIVLHPTGGDGVNIRSSEFGTQSQRPLLTVKYIPSICTDIDTHTRLSNDKTTWTNWQLITSGENISDSGEIYRYLEYKINMTSENSSITPSLKDIIFNYTAIVTDASGDYSYNFTTPSDGGIFNINVTSGLRTIYGNASTQLLIAGTPSIPVLNAPENATSISSITELNWINSTDYEGDTITYILTVDNDNDFSSPVYYNSSINETSSPTGAIPSNITSDDTYFWRVRAYDISSGNSSWSEVWQFTLDSSAPNITFINQTDEDELIVNTTHLLKEGQNLTLRINVTDSNLESVWVIIWDTIKDGTEKLKVFFTYLTGAGIWVADIATDYNWGEDFNYTIYANDSSGLTSEYDSNFSILKMNVTLELDPNPISSAQDVNMSGYLNFTNTTYLKNYPINLWFNGTLLLFDDVTPGGTYINDLNFSDTSRSTYDSGTYSNTTSNAENLTLTNGSYSGNYTKILDAGARVEWNNISWQSAGTACSGTNTYQEGDSNGYSGTRDAYIDGTATTTKFGTTSYLYIDSNEPYRSLIKFEDVVGFSPRGIPYGATISAANITINIFEGGTNPTAYEILENWSEGDVTYDDRLSGVSWESNGCASSPSRSTTAEDTFSGGTGSVTFNITNAMQSWSSQSTENYGIIIHPGGTNGLNIRSSEYNTQSNRPLLSVTYSSTDCTEIKIYTRLSNNKVTWTNWEEVTNGASINDSGEAYRYLEYKVDLATTDNSLSPNLEEITANFTAITTNATGHYDYSFSAPDTFGEYETKVNTSYRTIYTEATTILQIQSGVDPVVTLLTPPTQTWFNYTGFNITYNATDVNSDIKNATLIINGANNATTTTVSDTEPNNFTINFGSGQYNWTVNVWDFTDNMGTDTSRIFYIDLENPNVTLSYPADNAGYSTSEINLNFTATDNLNNTLSCDVVLDGTTIHTEVSATNNTQISVASGTLTDGEHIWNVTCTDESGRTSTSPTWTFNITDLPPAVSLVSPPNNHIDTTGNIDFIFNATDDSGFTNCSLIINGEINSSNQSSINNGQNTTITVNGFTEGDYNWTIGCYDLSESYIEATTQDFSVDLYYPQIELNLPTSSSTITSADVNLNFTATDTHDSSLTCTLTINGATVGSSFPATNATLTNKLVEDLTDGIKYWNITCSDDASHTNISETRNFTINEDPTVIINTINETSSQTGSINLTYTPYDNTNLSSCSLYLNGAYNQSNSTEITNGQASNFSLTGLTDGAYTYYINCTDYINLTGLSATNVFYIDSGAPTVTLYSPNGIDIYTSNVTFNFTVIDSIDSLLLCNLTVGSTVEDTFNATNGTSTIRNISGITDGYKDWYVNCSDSSDNIGSSTVYNFTKFSDPIVTIISPATETWFNYSTLNLTYYVEDDGGIKNSTLILDGAVNQSNSTPVTNFDYNNFTLTNYPDGQYNWSVNVTDITDLTGNSSTWIFYIDTQKPTIDLHQPNGTEIITTNNVTFNFTATDGVDSLLDCNISIDGEVEASPTATNATNSMNYILVSGGNHTWQVNCTDEAGNTNYSESINFTIIAPPTVTLNNPAADNRTTSQDINFTYTPSDAIGISKCDIYIDEIFNDTDASISEDQVNNFYITGIPEGQHNWTINCTDLDGDTAQPSARTFYIDQSPPSITLNSPENDTTVDANNNVLFNWTATDALDNLLVCNLTVDGVLENSDYATSGIATTEPVSGLSEGQHIWNVTCSDQLGNSNISEIRVFNYTYPDFEINESGITFSTTTPTEDEAIIINATVYNLGAVNASSVEVEFYAGNPQTSGIQIGATQSISIPAFSSTTASVSWDTKMGKTEIFVVVDPSNSFTELNETNNNASKNILIKSWHFFYGNVKADSEFKLADSSDLRVIRWDESNLTDANIYATDYDASINWLSLQAIGKDTSGSNSTNDIQEIDTLLNMTSFGDSTEALYLNAGEINETQSFFVFGDYILNVPITTSINSSNFKTGILWDTSDDTDTEFNSTDKEDIIFITKINRNTAGSYGVTDYELRVPAKLREYDPTDQTSAAFYIEIN